MSSTAANVTTDEPRRSSLKRAFTHAFAGNMIYTGCQGVMTIAMARLGPPELLGTFGLGIAIAAPVVELFGLQLHVVEAVDTKGNNSFYQYFRVQCFTSTLAMLVVAAIAMLGPYRREAFWTILACGFSKIIEAASLVCHGKMQQTERTDLLASSLTIRGLSGVCALVLAVWLTSSVAIGVLALAFAWLAVLLCYDIPAANSLEVVSESTERFALASLMPLALTALPLGLFAGMNSLMANAPRYFVECELGTRELGVFSAIAYLGLAARAFYTSILNAIVARLADHHHHGELKPFLRIIGKSLIAILALGIAGCLFVAFSGVYILMLFGRDYEDANDVLMLLTASMAMKTLWNLFVSALYAMKQFKVIFILQCTGGLFLFWLLSSWVDRYGLNGAAWAILVGSIFDVVIFSSVTLLILTYNRVHSNR